MKPYFLMFILFINFIILWFTFACTTLTPEYQKEIPTDCDNVTDTEKCLEGKK